MQEIKDPSVFDLQRWEQMQRDVIQALRRKVSGIDIHPFGKPLLKHMSARVVIPHHTGVDLDDFGDLPHNAQLRWEGRDTVVLIPLSFYKDRSWYLYALRVLLVLFLVAHLGLLSYMYATAHEVY